MRQLSRLSVFGLIGCFVVSQLGSVFKSGDGFNLYLFDIYTFIFCLFWCSYLVLRSKFVIPKEYIGFILFLVLCVISLIRPGFTLGGSELISSAFYFLRFLAYVITALIIWNLIDLSLLTPNELVKKFIFWGVLFCIGGFIQLYILPDFEILDSSLGWDPHKNRLASSFFDPNFAGGLLSLLIVLTYEKLNQKIIKYSLIALFVVSLILTFSRSSWGMFAGMIMVYGMLKYRKLILISILGFLLAYLAVPRIQTRISGITDPSDSASYRLTSWKNSISIIRDNFWLGTGFNTYRYIQKEYGFFEVASTGGNSGAGTDSSLLFVLATTGIFGALAYLFANYLLFFSNLNNAIPKIAIIVGVLIQSLFINSLFYPQILIILLMTPSLFYQKD